MGPWHSCECEKEDDDKSLFFSPLCFLLLSSKKKEGVCHFCKRIRVTGKKTSDKHKRIRAFQNRHNALSVVLSVLLLALFLEDIRCFFNLLAR